MISLFIDTCDTNYIVSVIKDNQTLFFFQSENSKDLSTKLLTTIEQSLSSSQLNVHDINKIFVTNGPGSFTGIRVGVTVAKTLAYSLNVPIYTVSRLECMATTDCDTDCIVPYIDARRDYVFAGIYDKDLNVILNDSYISIEELNKHIMNKSVTLISCSSLMDNTFSPKVNLLKLIAKHINDQAIDCHAVKPNYLKRTEAEEKRDERNI